MSDAQQILVVGALGVLAIYIGTAVGVLLPPRVGAIFIGAIFSALIALVIYSP